jgi:hypothetical protein
MDDLTTEEIAQNYSAALDSVDLINAGKPSDMSDEDWSDTLARNKEHLNIMIAKDYWTDEDLSSMISAAA